MLTSSCISAEAEETVQTLTSWGESETNRMQFLCSRNGSCLRNPLLQLLSFMLIVVHVTNSLYCLFQNPQTEKIDEQWFDKAFAACPSYQPFVPPISHLMILFHGMLQKNVIQLAYQSLLHEGTNL